MLDGDELLVSIQSDCPWGHAARNQLMTCARGDALMFIDDDDAYLPDALSLARQAVSERPDRVHLFRMRLPGGRELWADKTVRCGNVSTQMLVVPNDPARLGQWGDRYEGDFDFLTSTLDLHDRPPVFHPELIALYRPE
jgi:glycosyltransferase involved in cell wall biosynthesis